MDDAIGRIAFREALNQMKAGWHITERGIAGPAGALVRLTQRHAADTDAHVDVQFMLDEGASSTVGFWDCVVGYGSTPESRARSAAYLWANTTGTALFELKYSRRGEFADHYRGVSPDGLPSWHVIHGSIIGFGRGDSADRLQEWWLQHPLLPALAPALSQSLDETAAPHGIKILFGGGGLAEVMVNGEAHEAASLMLANLPWPRLQRPGFVRSYVVVLHRDP